MLEPEYPENYSNILRCNTPPDIVDREQLVDPMG